MRILSFQPWSSEIDDKIEVMWRMVRLAREAQDVPRLWKLNDVYVQCVADFTGAKNVDEVFNSRFLDAPIDVTSDIPVLICKIGVYPFSMIASAQMLTT